MFFFKTFAQENGFVDDLKHWDIAYWSQKQKEHLFRWDSHSKISLVIIFTVSHTILVMLVQRIWCWINL